MKMRITSLVVVLLCTANSFAQDKKTITKITEFLKKREIELVKKHGSSPEYEKEQRGKRKFILREIDLNNDKKKDYFVFFNNSCGNGGCDALILDSNLKIKGDFSLVETPVIAKAKIVNGWKVLNISSTGMREVIFNKQKQAYPEEGIANLKFIRYKKEKGDEIIIEQPKSTWKEMKSYLY
ncbi:hypothetical protein ACSLMH_12325 [Flavobacterium columnare]|uniref:hypothetical protein n=1 Tax=Flavobacterium columnare TaxID=996 RepID=UPI0007FB1C51|nr:hypothetical protein [Flavobacterium columnare]APT22062.1 hypothetical protein BU993_05075 [Flavobacterium columnare]